MTDIELKAGERIDQIAATDVQIIQSRDVFSFSIDAILLARFPRLPKKGKIVDMCAGNGAVGLFASSMTDSQIIELEIQERLAEMTQRSIQLNELDEQMTVINDNLNKALNYITTSSVDLIFCNPPYFKLDDKSHVNENPHYTLARHELATNLDEIFETSKRLLKTNGHLALVHRPERFFEIVDKMKKNHLVPKRIQFVYPKANQAANILLIDAIKDGKPGGEIFLPPLIVHDDSGNYTAEIQEIYYGKLE
ncbi:MAG TPA: SAM-dependent methyltransferase [Lactococcus sp.]|uniref:tRNA1(Val) (adenine(37)-N6)-methyltransferase n=1 Tax=Lactococcus TaxID=1357 RepID=UPI000E95FBC9|nr:MULTISPECIES: tRNA1(Val) (adenine(37)-N6)-methyltransferase [Lactococcus]MBL3717150.1 methyltransferase [Lactococcus garvieae]HBC90581.1 SAM-dependent methyltransferase [Lactococcus sp.]